MATDFSRARKHFAPLFLLAESDGGFISFHAENMQQISPLSKHTLGWPGPASKVMFCFIALFDYACTDEGTNYADLYWITRAPLPDFARSCVSGKCSPRSCDYFHSPERDGIMRGESRWGTCTEYGVNALQRDMHVEALVAQITYFSHLRRRNNMSSRHVVHCLVICQVLTSECCSQVRTSKRRRTYDACHSPANRRIERGEGEEEAPARSPALYAELMHLGAYFQKSAPKSY